LVKEIAAKEERAVLGEDRINHPKHYKRGGIEAIDVIEAWSLNFNVGNVIKYSCRAGYKDRTAVLEDLRKARFYITREINRLEKQA
jgi:hypothetical protein